jgi:hypothetical protein
MQDAVSRTSSCVNSNHRRRYCKIGCKPKACHVYRAWMS